MTNILHQATVSGPNGSSTIISNKISITDSILEYEQSFFMMSTDGINSNVEEPFKTFHENPSESQHPSNESKGTCLFCLIYLS
jgi:hypothetical protein